MIPQVASRMQIYTLMRDVRPEQCLTKELARPGMPVLVHDESSTWRGHVLRSTIQGAHVQNEVSRLGLADCFSFLGGDGMLARQVAQNPPNSYHQKCGGEERSLWLLGRFGLLARPPALLIQGDFFILRHSNATSKPFLGYSFSFFPGFGL